jgi:Protein of unknown function (DUF2804)
MGLPDRMPLIRGGRPRKAWTYVGAYGPDVMLCAAAARIGPIPVTWWAVWDRSEQRLTEGRRGVTVTRDGARVDGVFELALGDGAAVEVTSPHGRQEIWTRKRIVPARGRFGDRAVELRAIVDESAGYHARHTAWRWSAGVGVAESGAAIGWNLVEGIHDAVNGSERAVWIDGEPHELPRLAFAHDLSGVGDLRFTREAVRAARENYLIVRSDYEQPFGTFSGTLPVAGLLREGWGVMERHEVRW